jgi:hypothetical protein
MTATANRKPGAAGRQLGNGEFMHTRNAALTHREPGHAAEQDAPAAAAKQPLFLMNYTRPTYNGTVQVSYFWTPGLLRGGDLKFRMY